jgi:hypothetical protein
MLRRLLAAALAASAAWTAGCVQDPVIPKVGDDPILLSISLSTTTFRQGKPDTIRVTATNSFPEPVVLVYTNDCQILVTIRSASGVPVVPPNGQPTCIPLASQLRIPAEGSVTQRFVWTGLDRLLPTGSTTFLPPGTYFISAAIRATNYSTTAPAFKVELVAR